MAFVSLQNKKTKLSSTNFKVVAVVKTINNTDLLLISANTAMRISSMGKSIPASFCFYFKIIKLHKNNLGNTFGQQGAQFWAGSRAENIGKYPSKKKKVINKSQAAFFITPLKRIHFK